jgi:hypothetical protein
MAVEKLKFSISVTNNHSAGGLVEIICFTGAFIGMVGTVEL